MACGTAFAFQLKKNESAVVTKKSAIDYLMTINSTSGQLFVGESQYIRSGGVEVAKVADGLLFKDNEGGHTIWTYRDHMPGSTVVFGPAVDTNRPNGTLRRVIFGARSAIGCLLGTDYDEQ